MEVAAPRRLRTAGLAALLLALSLPVRATGAEGPSADPAPAAARVLRVATSGDYAPFSYPAASGDAVEAGVDGLDGFDIALARRFASERGYQLEFVRFRWPELAGHLAAGRFDIAMSGVTVRPERSMAGRLSVPVAATHAVALTWKGSGATSFDELDRPQRRIAVNAGGHLEKVARQVFRRADVVAIPDNEAVRMALLDRMFDAVVTDNYEEKAWTEGARDVVRLGPLSDDRKACLLPADRAELAGELDRWLMAREKDGTLAELRRRYFPAGAAGAVSAGKDGDALATARPLAALASAIVERQALMPFVYEAKRAAGAPITDEAQEAVVLDRAVRTAAAAAAAAAVAEPDPEAVRALFAALIAIGKDTQQRLAETDAKRRPQHLPVEHAANDAERAGSGPREHDSAGSRSVPPLRAHRTTRDLATELRPAIARIGEKIAVILASMDAPVAAAEAHRVLANALAAESIAAARIEALASAIERATSGRRPAGG